MSKGAWVRIMTAEGEQRSITIKKLPKGGIKNARVIEFNGVVLVAGQRGALYGAGKVPTSSYSYVGWRWGWLPGLASCLHYLGVISEADRDATIAKHEAAVADEKLQGDRSCFMHYAEELGLKDQARALLEG